MFKFLAAAALTGLALGSSPMVAHADPGFVTARTFGDGSYIGIHDSSWGGQATVHSFGDHQEHGLVIGGVNTTAILNSHGYGHSSKLSATGYGSGVAAIQRNAANHADLSASGGAQVVAEQFRYGGDVVVDANGNSQVWVQQSR